MTDHDNDVDTLVSEYHRGQIDRRELLRRAALLGLAASAVAPLLAAPGEAASTGSRVLRLGPYGSWGNFDPATNNSDGWTFPFATIYESLMAFRPGTTQPVNVLAQSVERSRDGKRIAFTLKRGIPFHHGFGELTAEDIKYSFERAAGLIKLYPDAKKSDVSWYPGDFHGMERVKLTGKYTGEILFKEPFTPFFDMTLPYTTSGMIASKKAVEQLGRKAWLEHPIGYPVGTGPYELVSYTPNKEAVFRRFKDYGGAASALAHAYDWDEIRVMIIPSTGLPAGESLTVPLQAGDVDFTTGLTARLARSLAGKRDLRTYAHRQPANYNFISVNVQHPNLRDIRVRQAIRYAIDVPALIAVQGESLSSRIYGCVPPELPSGHWPDAPRYNRDVDRAKHLMQKAGVSSLRVDLDASGAVAGVAKALGELIQANLAEIGITTNILLTRPADWITNVHKAQLTWTGYLGGPDPYFNLEWFNTPQIGFWNWAFWPNKEFDRLLVQLGRELDPHKRTEIAIRMQQLMDQSAGFIWVNQPVVHQAGSRHVKPAYDWDGNEILHLFKAV